MNNLKKPGLKDGYRYLGKRIKLGWEKNGSKICTVAGTTGLFLSGVHACRTTYKHHDDLKECGRRIREAGIEKAGEKKLARYWRITKEVAKCGIQNAKYYIPDLVGDALSAYAVSKGWHKEHAHYEQAAAIAGVFAADFMNYRMNVIAEQGEEADRRYLTKKGQAVTGTVSGNSDTKNEEHGDGNASADGLTINLEPGMLKIWYSRETTPQVWSDSLVIRQHQLEHIENELNIELVNAGFVTLNDIRRYFFGKKGDIPAGAIYGRIWDPGDREHPERGSMINLHFHEDVDFWNGLTDSCWIIIDIDPVPLLEMDARMRDQGRFKLTEV